MIETTVKIDNRLYERRMKKTSKKIIYDKITKAKVNDDSYESKLMKIDATRKKSFKRNNNRSNEKEFSMKCYNYDTEEHIARNCSKSRKSKSKLKIAAIQIESKNDHDDLNSSTKRETDSGCSGPASGREAQNSQTLPYDVRDQNDSTRDII